MKLAQFLGRTAVTVFLLIRVYQGSRVALVVVLALICLTLELAQLVTKWEKDGPPTR